jgi:septum site-determining protein MinD
VVGAKDGIGTSTLALNSAFALAKAGDGSVLLVDFDLNCQGDLELMLGSTWKEMQDVIDLMDREVPPSLLHGYLTHHDSGVSYLKVYNQQHGDVDFLTIERTARVFDYLSKAFDHIVVDCGSVITSAHAPIFTGSGKILLATLGMVNCLNHAKRKFELLTQGYIPSEKIHFVINQWLDDSKVPKSLVSEKLPKRTTYFLHSDPQGVMKSYEKASPIVIQAPKGSFSKSLSACIDEGLLTTTKQEYPLSAALSHDGNSLLEKWIAPFGQGQQATTKSKGRGRKKSVEPTDVQLEKRDETQDELIQVKQTILSKLLKTIDLKQIGVATTKEQKENLVKSATSAILKIINEIGEEKVPQEMRKKLVQDILNEALGLGPLETLMADGSISEIMINSKDQIYIERGGKLYLSDMRFTTETQLLRIIERIVSPIGRRVDESTPLVDARLADGSRVNIIIPPLALKGPAVTIRRFSENPLQVDDLIGFDTLNDRMATFLRACIEAKLNIIVSGGTGSGKTTLLNVLSSFIPQGDRIVTIEDAAELKLNQPHTITLEARPPNIEGKGAITIRDLVKNSLRMRPDRIVVGECRGGEALDMLQAMNTGHDGSMTTVHANSAKDAISRLETLVLFSGIDLPSKAIREQITGGIHLIVQLSRFSDGSRKVADIAELTGMEGNVVTLQSIFQYRQTGIDKNRKVMGKFAPTGVVPKFYDEMKQKGCDLSREIFLET